MTAETGAVPALASRRGRRDPERLDVRGLRLVFAPMGSVGDVLPFMAVAKELQIRGATVEFAGLPWIRSLVRAEGFAFTSVVPSTAGQADPAGAAVIYEPDEGGLAATCAYISRILMPNIAFTAESLAGAVAGADLLVGHPLQLAVGLVQRITGVPTAFLYWWAEWLPPSGVTAPADPRSPWERVRRTLSDAADSAVNKVGAEHGLAPLPDSYFTQLASAEALVLCYPRAWSTAGTDAANAAQVGYPYWDAPRIWRTRGRVERFLAEDDRPTVVMTLGSGRWPDWKTIASSVVSVARDHGARVILLQSPKRQEDDPDVLSVPYAPCTQVLPRASAVVHHGGLGTCMAALLHGTPSVIVPWVHDQPWNAAQMARLGTAEVVPHNDVNPDTLVASLARVLEPGYGAERSPALSSLLEENAGAACAAADELSRVALGMSRPTTPTGAMF